ncbi:hypothetical protein ACIF8T_37870 [Streptomyces sp. NPDC085946]|uniref:hypothetical protein n=1 Tax=Streptomyces sp. NPDC085946 TaxID=3365744 RepID=UPI0037D328C7
MQGRTRPLRRLAHERRRPSGSVGPRGARRRGPSRRVGNPRAGVDAVPQFFARAQHIGVGLLRDPDDTKGGRLPCHLVGYRLIGLSTARASGLAVAALLPLRRCHRGRRTLVRRP